MIIKMKLPLPGIYDSVCGDYGKYSNVSLKQIDKSNVFSGFLKTQPFRVVRYESFIADMYILKKKKHKFSERKIECKSSSSFNQSLY